MRAYAPRVDNEMQIPHVTSAFDATHAARNYVQLRRSGTTRLGVRNFNLVEYALEGALEFNEFTAHEELRDHCALRFEPAIARKFQRDR
jgi:hypothetical protein